MARPDTFALYRVAHSLGKSQGEIEEMPIDELNHWIAYLELMDAAR